MRPDSSTLKRCPGCGVEKPATTEFFRPRPERPCGITSRCRECINKRGRDRQQRTRSDQTKAEMNRRQTVLASGMKVCKECGIEKPATVEFFPPEKRGLHGVKAVCRECKKVYYKGYNAAHKAERKAGNDSWRAANYEYAIETSKKRYWDNREESLAYSAEWRAENPYACRCYGANARAREFGLDEMIAPEDIAAVLESQHSLCRYCGVAVGPNFHVDHAVPFTRGGHNVRENLAVSCPHCNQTKWRKTPEEFAGTH